MITTSIDEARLEAFIGQAVTDVGAIISAPLFVSGECLALQGDGARGSTRLAAGRRSVVARSSDVWEWLGNLAAGRDVS